MTATITRRAAIAGSVARSAWRRASAQSGRPEGTITIVHGFTPGGNVDLTARLIAERLGGETRPADRRRAASPAPAARPRRRPCRARGARRHGRCSWPPGGHAVSAAIYNKLPYDALEDFSWISMLSDFPFVFVTYPESPGEDPRRVHRTWRKREAGKLLCAHPGNGTGQHLALELFAATAGIKVQGVSVSRLAAGRDRPARQARRHLHGTKS